MSLLVNGLDPDQVFLKIFLKKNNLKKKNRPQKTCKTSQHAKSFKKGDKYGD